MVSDLAPAIGPGIIWRELGHQWQAPVVTFLYLKIIVKNIEFLLTMIG
jgi:hypothetical protein